ncbi:MAG TPA: hypothetical protein VGC51_08390 [Hansschlegelia sp.]
MRIDALNQRIDPLPVALAEIARLKTTSEQLDNRLSSGREERFATDSKMADSINQLRTDIALLRQLVEAQSRTPPLRKPFLTDTPRAPIIRAHGRTRQRKPRRCSSGCSAIWGGPTSSPRRPTAALTVLSTSAIWCAPSRLRPELRPYYREPYAATFATSAV